MGFITTLFYFIITLGVLVLVHELGHFAAAKLCRMRVDIFSIGFPPRAFGKKIGDTDYCISWIPIGGYVKIAGMIDESFDTEFLNKSPEAWEFRARPIWQRIIVICAGVIMNLLLAVLIFWGINYVQGKSVWDTTEIGYVVEDSPAAKAGFVSGDKVLSINGRSVSNWDALRYQLYIDNIGSDLTVTVMRDGKETSLHVPRAVVAEQKESLFGITPSHADVVIETVVSGMPADKLGLKPGDVLVALNDTPIRYDKKVTEIVHAHAGKELSVRWKHNGEMMSGKTTPTDKGLIGISFSLRYSGPVTRTQYSLFGALPEGLRNIANVTVLTYRGISQMITGKMSFSQSVAGPVRIAQMASQTAELGLITYLGFMAFLSVSLALLNILPFPALDGGHLMFLLYEGTFRREIPVKVKLFLQKAGFVLLLAFMAFAVYNDIINF